MIDVIIPCFNAANTLARAVESVLAQPNLGRVIVVDDASTDESEALLAQWQAHPQIVIERFARNQGVAKARNWGALQASTRYIAFLDADDALDAGALAMAEQVLAFRPEISVLRWRLRPIGLAACYAEHPDFARAWQTFEMTCGGNVVCDRAFFLATGGFPTQALFREFGGEDGSWGIATTQVARVATLFNEEIGVQHFCREGMHAERLLNAMLFGEAPAGISDAHMAEAQGVTEAIIQQVQALNGLLQGEKGVMPLTLNWG